MKKFIKPLVLAAIASSLVGIASATPAENYYWIRSIQINPELSAAFEAVNTQVTFTNPTINKRQVFVVTSPAVCSPSLKFDHHSCWVGLRDVSLGLDAYTTKTIHGKTYDVARTAISPFIRFSYDKSSKGGVAMPVHELEVMAVQQQGAGS